MTYPTYTPDRWVILKITNKETKETFYKVFAGWLGSFTQGQSWKINSGIDRVEIENDFYLFFGRSGSVYQCYKSYNAMSAYMADILDNFVENSKDYATIEIVPVTEVL